MARVPETAFSVSKTRGGDYGWISTSQSVVVTTDEGESSPGHTTHFQKEGRKLVSVTS